MIVLRYKATKDHELICSSLLSNNINQKFAKVGEATRMVNFEQKKGEMQEDRLIFTPMSG